MSKILIVEDNVELIGLISILLEKNGHRIAKASSREETMLQVDLLKPELILMDVMLGNENGNDICKEIKAAHKDIKIVLISANPNLLEDYREYDADATLPKPFELKLIINKINELLHL